MNHADYATGFDAVRGLKPPLRGAASHHSRVLRALSLIVVFSLCSVTLWQI